jgi:hypothetical protein
MTTNPHKGDRLEALLKQLPPLRDNPEFAANVVGVLRRGHLVRGGVIAGSALAGIAAMLALVPLDLIVEILSFLGDWSGSVEFSAPELTKENAAGAAVVFVLFLVSLMATQDT